MSNIQVFANSEIRFVDHPENKFGFGIVAADIAKVLNHSNSRLMTEFVDDEWKGVSNVYTLGGNQSMAVIWEPGIYQLLAKSRKPQAKPFQKWLFEDVLPSIRKTGQYAIAQPQLPQTYLEALKALVASEERLMLAQAEVEVLEEANQALSEAVDELYNYSSIIRIAKFNGISEERFKWHRLKTVSAQLGLEIKRVPCARFGTKNLYSHDAWLVAYPYVNLPETTTLVVKAS